MILIVVKWQQPLLVVGQAYARHGTWDNTAPLCATLFGVRGGWFGAVGGCYPWLLLSQMSV